MKPNRIRVLKDQIKEMQELIKLKDARILELEKRELERTLYTVKTTQVLPAETPIFSYCIHEFEWITTPDLGFAPALCKKCKQPFQIPLVTSSLK